MAGKGKGRIVFEATSSDEEAEKQPKNARVSAGNDWVYFGQPQKPAKDTNLMLLPPPPSPGAGSSAVDQQWQSGAQPLEWGEASYAPSSPPPPQPPEPSFQDPFEDETDLLEEAKEEEEALQAQAREKAARERRKKDEDEELNALDELSSSILASAQPGPDFSFLVSWQEAAPATVDEDNALIDSEELNTKLREYLRHGNTGGAIKILDRMGYFRSTLETASVAAIVAAGVKLTPVLRHEFTSAVFVRDRWPDTRVEGATTDFKAWPFPLLERMLSIVVATDEAEMALLVDAIASYVRSIKAGPPAQGSALHEFDPVLFVFKTAPRAVFFTLLVERGLLALSTSDGGDLMKHIMNDGSLLSPVYEYRWNPRFLPWIITALLNAGCSTTSISQSGLDTKDLQGVVVGGGVSLLFRIAMDAQNMWLLELACALKALEPPGSGMARTDEWAARIQQMPPWNVPGSWDRHLAFFDVLFKFPFLAHVNAGLLNSIKKRLSVAMMVRTPESQKYKTSAARLAILNRLGVSWGPIDEDLMKGAVKVLRWMVSEELRSTMKKDQWVEKFHASELIERVLLGFEEHYPSTIDTLSGVKLVAPKNASSG